MYVCVFVIVVVDGFVSITRATNQPAHTPDSNRTACLCAQGVTLVVKDVAGAVIQATANGGKVIQDVQTLEYPATQVRGDVCSGGMACPG